MDQDPGEARLSRIVTSWSMIYDAHQDEDNERVSAAQREMLLRYHGAIFRYLRAAVRDSDLAEDLAQEFAIRFLRGDFHRATPERGRFRDLIKRSVSNMITDHYRRKKVRGPAIDPTDLGHAEPEAESFDTDGAFVESWRQDLLSRAWADLEALERERGKPYHRVLKLRTDEPKASSTEMAEMLSTALGQEVNAAWVRQVLHRAREKFGDYLLDEISATLRDDSAETLERELEDLNLLEYCRPALERRSR